MANILVIAYDYPPILSPESIQVQRRIITLAKNNNKIFVITSHNDPLFEFIDNSLIMNHSNINIYKTKKPIFEKILNMICKILNITDRKFWWQYYAFEKAKDIIKENKIDIIYSHSTPLVDHLVGLKLKNIFPKIKWISHFSDPWTLNLYVNYNYFIKKVNQILEKKVLLNSDIVSVTSDKTKELFLENYKFLKNKIFVLPHVFDKSLYNKSIKNNGTIVVTHTGNIYGLRTIKYLLEAIKEIEFDNVEFHFYGKIKEKEKELIKKYKLENIVKIYNQIPYLESLKVISNSDFLLLIDAPLKDSPFFPSKLADYIGAKKPIIALTPKNSTTIDILKNIKNDYFIASPDNKNEIKSILEKILNFDGNLSFDNVSFYDMKNYSLLKEIFEK